MSDRVRQRRADVWLPLYGRWHHGTIDRPIDPARREYYVFIEGDPRAHHARQH